MTTRTPIPTTDPAADVNYTKRLYNIVLIVLAVALLSGGWLIWQAKMNEGRKARECARAQTVSQVAHACR